MYIKLDWLSFTLDIEAEPQVALEGDRIARLAIRALAQEYHDFIYNGIGFDYAGGRPPYRYAFRRQDGGCMIFIGSNTKTVLYELSGKGCDDFNELGIAKGFLSRIPNNVTRIDVAIDMLCDERPADFANSRLKGKSLSLGFQKSPTGETVYLGSQKSDRYCRIYRYEEPHPRAKLLRFETVYKKDFAKALAWAILDADSWESIAAMLDSRYRFSSPNFTIGNVEPTSIRLPRSSRTSDKTVTWLFKQCAPALARVLNENLISLEEFLEEVEKSL